MKKDASFAFGVFLFAWLWGFTTVLPAPCYGQRLVSVRIAPTDFDGNRIATIEPNSSFLLNLYTADIRPAPKGVFAVYADVLYETELFEATANPMFSDEYSAVGKGDWSISGIIDEAGAVWNYDDFRTLPGGGEFLVLSVPMNSLQQTGTGVFSLDPADSLPFNETAIFGSNTSVSPSLIQFAGSQLTVGAELACDADLDGDCDIADLDMLYAAFGSASSLDLNGSGIVESGDIPVWLTFASSPSNVAKLHAAHVYVNGDVNLDGSVNSSDLGILINRFGDTSGLRFANGNLNDDANIDSRDLGILLNEWDFSSLAALAVPEPEAHPILLISLFGWIGLRLRKRQEERSPAQMREL